MATQNSTTSVIGYCSGTLRKRFKERTILRNQSPHEWYGAFGKAAAVGRILLSEPYFQGGQYNTLDFLFGNLPLAELVR